MQILVFGNFALVFALGLISFLGFNSGAMASVTELPNEAMLIATMQFIEVKERVLPLVAGVLLIGVTYCAAWRGWMRSPTR